MSQLKSAEVNYKSVDFMKSWFFVEKWEKSCHLKHFQTKTGFLDLEYCDRMKQF